MSTVLASWTKVCPGGFMLAYGREENRVCAWLSGQRGAWEYKITRRAQILALGTADRKRDAMLDAQTRLYALGRRGE